MTAMAILMDGAVYASWLFLTALGLTLIYGVMKILNIAHGSFYALGAYAAASSVGAYFAGGHPPAGSFLLLPLAAVAMGVVWGLLIERGVLRFLYGRDEVVMVLVTYAIFLVLEDTIKLLWGTDPYFAYQPYGLLGVVEVAGLVYPVYDFLLIALAAGSAAAAAWGLHRTRVGKLLVAVIHDREMSAAFGINVTAVFTATFVVGAVLGALGGAVTAPKVSVVPGIGVEVIVLAFAVVVIGGLGSVGGAMVGAVIVGLARAAAVHLLPEAELFVIYGVMALVLALRPHGLFAGPEVRKI
ncbi:MAG: branched-chain amino acid ABC transporter permease [Deferrisomatales bacterium]